MQTSSSRFDWLMTLLSVWLVSGLLLDLWAHRHGLAENTFFTLWHGLYYTGYLTSAAALGIAWRRGTLPPTYRLSLIGAAIFAASGLADFVKHTLYGFDLAAEAPINPPHLGLMLGMALMVSAGLRQENSPSPNERMGFPLVSSNEVAGKRGWGVKVTSLILTMTLATLAVQFAHPLGRLWPTPAALERYDIEPGLAISLGLAGLLIHTALIVGFILPTRRWSLPFGSLALALGLHSLAMSTASGTYHLIPAGILAGLAADLLMKADRSPSLIGAALGVIYTASYLGVLALTSGMWWPLHVWSGALLLTGIAGWLVEIAMSPREG